MAKKTPKAISTNIVVEQWPIDKPIPYPKNARRVSEVGLAKLCNSIKTYGFVQPLVVDEEGVLIIGHTRLKAAQSLGMTQVPVFVAKGLSPEKVRALRIADNRTAQETTWDEDLLKEELGELSALFGESPADVDYLSSMTGFDVEEIEEIAFPESEEIPADDTPAPPENVRPKREILVSCTCPKCGHEWTDGNKPKVAKP